MGPAKMRTHLEEAVHPNLPDVYGLIFAAACDFSKATRDACRDRCPGNGLSEVLIWGKSEIEDSLFQPKNDHLRFAYFGISLTVRKRTATAQIRSRTTLKPRLQAALRFDGGGCGGSFILRDPEDERYPYREGDPPTRGWR